jgi:hypothetical protein
LLGNIIGFAIVAGLAWLAVVLIAASLAAPFSAISEWIAAAFSADAAEQRRRAAPFSANEEADERRRRAELESAPNPREAERDAYWRARGKKPPRIG